MNAKRDKARKGTAAGSPSNVDVKLSPTMTGRAAATAILACALKRALIHERKVRRGAGGRSLHDYRVLLRRARAALSQIKGVFPEDLTARFKEDLSSLCRAANAARDLETHLEGKEKYLAALPESLAPQVNIFFNDLDRRYKAERIALSKRLGTKKFAGVITRWLDFLKGAAVVKLPKSENAKKPSRALAKKFILKSAAKLAAKLGSLDPLDSSPEDLHKLRILCKKTRYLLEFFASILPKKEHELVTKRLIRLQDALGHFNDLTMHRKFMEARLAETASHKTGAAAMAAAVGAIIASLHLEREQARRPIKAAFNELRSKQVAEAFKKICQHNLLRRN